MIKHVISLTIMSYYLRGSAFYCLPSVSKEKRKKSNFYHLLEAIAKCVPSLILLINLKLLHYKNRVCMFMGVYECVCLCVRVSGLNCHMFIHIRFFCVSCEEFFWKKNPRFFLHE